MVENDLLKETVQGFHRMARPLQEPMESIRMKSHPHQMDWKMLSASILAHFVSCNIRIFGFSIWMQFRRILCLDQPLSPQMFQVIIFIIKRVGLGGGIPPRAYGSTLS
jgi:hypothetical protein